VRTTRAVFGTLVLGVFILFGISTAVGQEQGTYSGPLFGTLGVEGSDFSLGATFALVGDGFDPSGPVVFSVRDNNSATPTVEGESAADGSGAVRIEVTLTEEFTSGTYTATVSGTAPDGGTVELSAAIAVEVPIEPTPEPEASSPLPTPVPRPTASAAPTPTTVSVPVPVATATALPAVGEPEQATTEPSDESEPAGTVDEQQEEAAENDDTAETEAPGEAALDSEEALSEPGDADSGSGWTQGRWVAALAAVAVVLGAAFVLKASASSRAASRE